MRMKFRGATTALAALLGAAGVMALARPVTAADEPRRIEITSQRFSYSPAEITVRKGEHVVLSFHTQDVTHGIKFEELGLNTEISKDGGQLDFTPDKTGDFVGRCSHFCGTGHGSMTLTLHVTE